MNKKNIIPLLLTLFIITADQISKIVVVKLIPLGNLGATYLDGFLKIIHVRNPGAAFSLGSGLEGFPHFMVMVGIPMTALIVLTIYLIRTENITKTERWSLYGILGGGLGNQIDRIFRPDGVVDFIDVKFYGIFGWERWPTFNIADSAVVVCGIILAISFIVQERRLKEYE